MSIIDFKNIFFFQRKRFSDLLSESEMGTDDEDDDDSFKKRKHIKHKNVDKNNIDDYLKDDSDVYEPENESDEEEEDDELDDEDIFDENDFSKHEDVVFYQHLDQVRFAITIITVINPCPANLVSFVKIFNHIFN